MERCATKESFAKNEREKKKSFIKKEKQGQAGLPVAPESLQRTRVDTKLGPSPFYRRKNQREPRKKQEEKPTTKPPSDHRPSYRLYLPLLLEN